MLVIDFNKEISDKRIDSYLLILEQFILHSSSRIELRFLPHTLCSPAGLAILCCLIDKACEANIHLHWRMSSRLEKRYPFLKQLREIPFHPPSLPPARNYFYEDKEYLLSVGENTFDFTFIEKFSSKFNLSEDLQFDCKLILQELIQNTVSHSGGERYYAYAGFWKKEIHLGILDMGVSIPSKLQQKYQCKNDLEYILLALEEGITTRRQRVGGLGLTHFKDALKNNAGKLTLISGNAQVRYYFQTRQSQKSFLKYRLPGTWCCARIPL